MSRRRAIAAAAALVALLVVPAQAQTETRCVMEGPVPGFRALRLDLPAGSDFLVLELHGQRNPRPVNDESSWHLAEGIAVIDADTREIVAHQVINAGTSPPVVVAEAEGQRVRSGAAAPEGAWIHSARKASPDLAPGTYYVVAFGVGGPSGGALAQRWGASLYVRGAHSCASTAAGEVFDHNHTHFTGGTQVHVPGAGYADEASLSFVTERPLVVGFMDAGYQGGDSGSVSLAYEMPSAAGVLGREVVPFVSGPGEHSFTASYRGLHPVVTVAGVAVEVP